MKLRIAIWIGAGIAIAGLWALYIASQYPEVGIEILRQPLVKALLYVSCPISYFGHYYAIRLINVLVANGVTYGLVGSVFEIVRHTKHARIAH